MVSSKFFKAKFLIDLGCYSDVWPGEIPPGWELEWVEDDY
jgi:hypothetical protein